VIIPVKVFTYAEAYHQKYYLTRQHDIRDFLSSKYPDGKGLADSAVATRLNAYLGSGMALDWEAFRDELASYGLPEPLETRLRKAAGGRI
jgi:peptide-methionine (S)-S-oxide reductase